MHAVRTAAALAFAGAVLLAPSLAQADPWVDITTNGTPVENGATGVLGQPLTIHGSGCDNASGTAVMGDFASPFGDPGLLTEQQLHDEVAAWRLFQVEKPVDQAGSFDWSFDLALDDPSGDFTARWYCATAPVDSLSDPAITWISPVATMTVSTAAPAAKSAKAATATKTVKQTMLGTKTAAATPPVEVSFNFDPDALPLVDRVGIPGAKAASLKAKVDADLATAARARESLARLVQIFDKKAAAALRAPATNSDYVRASYLRLAGKVPTKQALSTFTSRLDKGDLRVSVVEDIALTQHDAGWWMKQK